MNKNRLVAIAAVVAVAVASYTAGHWRASRSAEAMMLANGLASVGACANALNLLADQHNDRAVTVLTAQLRTSVTTVQQHKEGARFVPIAIPSLVDSLRRAQVYSDRTGDQRLSGELQKLRSELRPLSTRRSGA